VGVPSTITGWSQLPAQQDNGDLAEAVRRMRAWVEHKEKPGPKLYVPREELPPAPTILEKLNMTKEEFDHWEW
jgi:hypothetical protein